MALSKPALKLNQKGQGLVEYLILVALMAVATIGVVRALQHNLSASYTEVIYALQGSKSKQRAKRESLDESIYKKRDLSDFMNGASSRSAHDE